MYPSNLIYESFFKKPPEFKGGGKCVFCGKPAPKNYSKIIKNTFTDIDYLKDGDGVCVACEFAITDRKENSCRKMSAIYHKGGFIRFTALELIDLLFNPSNLPEPPFFFALSYSKKKHLFYKGVVSLSKNIFWIQTDDVGFGFNPKRWEEVYKDIETLYSVPEEEKKKKNPKTFFTKQEIISLSPPISKIAKFGVERFCEIKKRLLKVNNTPEYEMLVYGVRPKL